MPFIGIGSPYCKPIMKGYINCDTVPQRIKVKENYFLVQKYRPISIILHAPRLP